MSSIIFFIGILLAVATLEHSKILPELEKWLDETLGNTTLVIMLIGLMSSLVDNVPMVAASIKMFPMDLHPKDSYLWQFLAFCAGTAFGSNNEMTLPFVGCAFKHNFKTEYE